LAKYIKPGLHVNVVVAADMQLMHQVCTSLK